MPSVDISCGSGKTASVADRFVRIQNQREEIACERKNHLSNSKTGPWYQVSKTGDTSSCAQEICWSAGHSAITGSSQDPSSLPLRSLALISRTTSRKRRILLISSVRRVTNTRFGARKRPVDPRPEAELAGIKGWAEALESLGRARFHRRRRRLAVPPAQHRQCGFHTGWRCVPTLLQDRQNLKFPPRAAG